jgi:hypothetical protein
VKSRGPSTLAVVLAVAALAQGVALVLLGRLEWRLALEVLAVTAALAGLVHQAWVHRLRLNHRIDMFLVMGVFGGLGMLAGWWVDLGFTAPPRDAGFHAAMGHGCGDHTAAAAGGEMALDNGLSDVPTPAPVTDEPSCCDGDSPGPGAASPAAPTGGGGHGVHGGGGGTFWPMVFSWMTGLMLLGAIPPGLAFTRCADLARTSRRRWLSTHLIGNALMIAGMIWLGHWIGPILARWTGSAIIGGHVGMLAGMLLGMEAGMFLGEALLGLQPWREWTWRGERESQAPVGSPSRP